MESMKKVEGYRAKRVLFFVVFFFLFVSIILNLISFFRNGMQLEFLKPVLRDVVASVLMTILFFSLKLKK